MRSAVLQRSCIGDVVTVKNCLETIILTVFNLYFLPAVNVKTAEIFPATFPEKGPDEDLRSAHILTGAPVSKSHGENGKGRPAGAMKHPEFEEKTPLVGLSLWVLGLLLPFHVVCWNSWVM